MPYVFSTLLIRLNICAISARIERSVALNRTMARNSDLAVLLDAGVTESCIAWR